MNSAHGVTFLRYWGSHFKSRRHAGVILEDFRPLVRRRWRCYLVLERRPDDPAWLQGLLDLGVNLVCLPRPRRNFDGRSILRVCRLVRQIKATIFHCDNLHTSPLIGAALGGAPVRFWAKRAMNPEFEECRKATFKERLAVSLRVSCRLCSRVIAVSQAVKDELAGLGIAEEKILVRHNPLRLGRRDVALDRRSARAGWGCSSAHVVIITLGRAAPVKGWDLLLEAFARVAQNDSNARLVLVGSYTSGEEQRFHAKLTEFMAGQRLADKVVFTGHTGDIAAVLQAADIFVLPSRSEGCSSAPVEALEAGLPCVLTRVGHAAEIIKPGVNGFLVERCDTRSLAEALLQLTQSERLRAAFARNAILPPTILTMEEYAEQIARDYEEALREAVPNCVSLLDAQGIN